MTTLLISQIRTDGGTQPRAAMDHDLVESYMEAMEAGAKFPPVDVFYDGTDYWLADGFHRCKAAWAAEKEEIAVNVIQGTLEDARWFSYAANATNGLYRSNSDKQRAVQAALKHPRSVGLNDSDIARHVGVGHATVSAWRQKIDPSFQIGKIAERTVTRGGTTYQQDTTNIGRTRDADPEAARLKGIEPKKIPAIPILGSKRREMLDNSARERVIAGISQIGGICEGLGRISLECVWSGCPAEERKAMAANARASATFLKNFAHSIEVMHDSN